MKKRYVCETYPQILNSQTDIMKRFAILSILTGIFLSCDTPVQFEDETDPIEKITFSYLQDEAEIYVAADLKDPFNGVTLDSVHLLWYGKNGFSHDAPDDTSLYDSGNFGDILAGDNKYSRKVGLSTLSDTNTITYEDTGQVYLEVYAYYRNNMIYTLADSFGLQNLIPNFMWVDAPDTLVLPDSGFSIIKDIRAKVYDPNGMNDIKWVGFNSRHVEPDTMLNNGNYIYLFDDGDEDLHGDVAEGDSVYTVRINFPWYAKTGLIEWGFRVQDFKDDYSEISHLVLILEE